ncbi:MAG TPA: PQQ-binding-like beta-propeller repeat protein [bacterium]|nr:PQQ-binding-like beta-propeller repeat protein [bacterium]
MRKNIFCLSFVLLLVLASCAGAASFWPVFQHDPGHTGVAPVSTPESLELLWAVEVWDYSGGCHLVAADGGGVWYCQGAGGGGTLRLSRDGEIVARGPVAYMQGGSAAVLSDGTLVIRSIVRNLEDQSIAAVSAIAPNGDVRWELTLGEVIDRLLPQDWLLTLGANDDIYAVGQFCLYAVSPGATSGTIRWSYACDNQISTIPAAASDGTVYFGTTNTSTPKNPWLYCLKSDGSLNWTFEPTEDGAGKPRALSSAPTLDNAGRIYFVVSGNALYCLNRDGSVHWYYPIERSCYTSPILMRDGSVVFYEMKNYGSYTDEWRATVSRYHPDLGGSAVKLPTKEAPLSSAAADADGNIFVSFKNWDASTSTTTFEFGRVNLPLEPWAGSYEPLYSMTGYFGAAGGPCIDEDGTVYCLVGNKIVAFGRRQGLKIGIQTNSSTYAGWSDFYANVSLQIRNAEIAAPLDCYIAWKQPDKNELLFYPFWTNDPWLAAMQFRPLPGDAFFEKIEIAHFPLKVIATGEHKLYTAFFEPGTFNLVSDIASCEFIVYGAPTRREARKSPAATDLGISFNGDQMGTPPTVAVWTNKETYAAGEVLDLSLRLENEGMGMFFDLYIAATLDDDPNGTLFFFPTWRTDPGFTNISFLPLAQGASLPDWTIMHLPLPDALPRGGYRFLAAFFYQGTFNLASNVAESHWSLM